MDWISDTEGIDDFEWDSDDDTGEERRREIHYSPSSWELELSKKTMVPEVVTSSSDFMAHYVGMGFSREMVAKAMTNNGGGDSEAILESLLAYAAVEESPPDHENSSVSFSSMSDKDDLDADMDDMDDSEDKDFREEFLEKNKILILVEMGYKTEEASSAINRCGSDASIMVLVDSIHAAEMGEETYDDLKEFTTSCSAEDKTFRSCRTNSFRERRRTKTIKEKNKRKRVLVQRDCIEKVTLDENDDPMIILPNPMVGFGLPNERVHVTHRRLQATAIGPPYFYYENVALAPKGVWETISRFLYDIEPEFVDSKYFCAIARKRAYVHNLPIENRFPILPIPPRTIHDAFPLTRKWWPTWDPRTQLNCLQTCIASAKLTERIRLQLASSDDPPSPKVRQYVLSECRRWNLVWVGLHRAAPLEPDEIEYLLGFPRNHTREGGISRMERYRCLGNSFQVDTVAFHLSVLKEMFPNGMTVLSLFSGIGGAEVALHRLGIHMKTVVSVEISEIKRNIVRGWWEQTNQTGMLIEIADVQQVSSDDLQQLINTYGGFDLVIGGSPCNNLSGSNRHTRDGLKGEQSALFYHFYRILDLVRCIMGRK